MLFRGSTFRASASARGVVLADVEAVDVYLNQLRRRADVERDPRPVGGGDPIAEAASNGEDHVGLLRHLVAAYRARVSAGPGVELVFLGDCALAVVGDGDRCTEVL